MLKVKEWKYNDMIVKACRYGDKWMEFDCWERESDVAHEVIVDEDEFVTYNGSYEIIKETAKALQIRFADAWTEWLPKSAVEM